jgi:hypothetical protein
MEATKKMADLPLAGISAKSSESLKNDQRQLFARVSDEALSDWSIFACRFAATAQNDP